MLAILLSFRYNSSMTALQPIKASLIADLVDVINENLGVLLHVHTVACPDCKNVAPEDDLGCATCSGTGAVEHYGIDSTKLQQERYGRLIEGFDFKGGQLVPKFRSKDKAFATLVKLLGLDKALIEIANATTFSEAISAEQRAAYVEQLKELASMGLLDGN